MKPNSDFGQCESITLCIPPDLNFFDLHLRWNEDGAVLFDWDAIERLCAASGIDCGQFRQSGATNVARLINCWYEVHLRNGGPVDMVKEEAKRYGATLWGQHAMPMMRH